ncbi:transcriptional regulator [Shinella sp. CPCC 101442]|uniref:transcriptional regulator n=1 Tax=Shinella sp. CPCC 101442 TaxID=2932265 RepID=UPI0021527628|nr:transcriptional regulator [Shinella sp. CPCC 101442]MCR6499069.1 transcriptional regulator [Shinella sp. CPCC 101442]
MPSKTAAPQKVRPRQKAPPENLSELKERIVYGQLALSEDSQRLLGVALEDPALIAFGTVASVAHACSVSMATVARTGRAFGFGGFRDLRAIFRTYIRHLGGGAPDFSLPTDTVANPQGFRRFDGDNHKVLRE